MKKKIISLCLVVMIPTMTVIASEKVNYSLDEAVNEILSNDSSIQSSEDEIELSNAARNYLDEFTDELEELQEVQQEYNEKSKLWSAEYSAYAAIYEYLKAEESLQLQEENLEITKKELDIVGVKYDEGLASEQDLIQAEMSVSNAEFALQSSEQRLNQMKYQLNQQLDNELNTTININDIGEISRLSASEYDAEDVAYDMTLEHESLIYYRFVMDTYEEIIEESEDLSGAGSYSGQIDSLETQITALQAEIDELIANGAEQTIIDEKEVEKQYLMDQKSQLESQASSDRRNAEEDLQEYYEQEKEKAQADLFDQMDKIELAAYGYADQIELAHLQLDMLEENIETQQQLYDMQEVRYNEGLITATDLEKSRTNLLDAKLDLVNAEMDYALLLKEFELFKEGLLK
ncbi:TolC family protein [Chengkuizengella axinellae]|uniref:TolC family protein n=1 Tax=Chengkuizengella axinellae TaxID=3064388 RepID=A0ABT9J0G7_9BACL|nr:TolC family protein [Chengkuizengella sp. 2205SS18-9]MDP5274514.1 TolC family protein [Chengkuizengella sp. 2205SS18-9]